MASDTATRQTGGTRPRSSLGAVLVVLVAALLVAAPARGQALPQSLEGEMFVADQLNVTSDCGGIGSTFTITYTASGTASGPYIGPFTETGTITGEITSPIGLGQITAWNASFTIDSAAGDVDGQKTFGSSGVVVQCERVLVLVGGFTTATAELAYKATIKTSAGTFADQGQATADLEDSISNGNLIRSFQENFILSTGVLPTSGKATGGGQVISGSDPRDRVTFGFNVRKTADGSRLQGACNVRDHATGTHVKCLTVTDYVQIGNTATLEGTASVNGVQRPYRITVQDNGEPNMGADTFSITAGTYQAGGNVQNGNIKIHKQ